jgi:ketosteroid isomerase-like protein
MRTPLYSSLSALLLAFASLHAEEDPRLPRLEAADNARVAAFRSGDSVALNAVLSNELRYAHSSGAVDSKESLIQLISSGKTKYTDYNYEERKFTFPAPKIALMSGRTHVRAETANGVMDGVLSFLAVWREEADGQWKFLAWQSCRLPVPAP